MIREVVAEVVVVVVAAVVVATVAAVDVAEAGGVSLEPPHRAITSAIPISQVVLRTKFILALPVAGVRSD